MILWHFWNQCFCSFGWLKFLLISFLLRLFAVTDDIFCLFQGHIENVAHLKQQYGLGKNANEVIIILEAYRTLRDRGPYPADQVLRDFQGKFAFVLYDGSSKTAFVAAVSFSSLIYISSYYSLYFLFICFLTTLLLYKVNCMWLINNCHFM